jgi:hypothetical protein
LLLSSQPQGVTIERRPQRSCRNAVSEYESRFPLQISKL